MTLFLLTLLSAATLSKDLNIEHPTLNCNNCGKYMVVTRKLDNHPATETPIESGATVVPGYFESVVHAGWFSGTKELTIGYGEKFRDFTGTRILASHTFTVPVEPSQFPYGIRVTLGGDDQKWTMTVMERPQEASKETAAASTPSASTDTAPQTEDPMQLDTSGSETSTEDKDKTE